MHRPDERVTSILIEEEMKSSYIDYSMSVIVSRALPDVRDGLKPVQRRILVAMNDLNLMHNRPYRKSAKITGDVTGNYHPHGTVAVYDTMARLVQDFSLRYPIVDGQGNFGSIDGDGAAAERYTEARLSRLAEELLVDLEKGTVDFRPNYDATREEPVVLPGKAPNLLINGSAGIAVGMATNVPPQNLREVCEAITCLIDRPEATVDELMEFVQGPDFPTGGMIQGTAGIRECYTTGHGLITIRARATIEELRAERLAIIVTEIPYQVNKAALLERIAELVKSGVLQGISDLRDESDRDGMRVVIELRADAQPRVVLNQLYKHTQMQTTFGANLLALIHNRPKLFTLKELCQSYIDHRVDVITRRTTFDLEEARKRAHILEGLKVALDQIDAVITLIRESRNAEEARAALMAAFGLTQIQAQAILEMQLQRLAGLEREKIEGQYQETLRLIAEYEAILSSRGRVLELITADLRELAEKYGDARRTEIEPYSEDIDLEDLIPREDMIITITHRGYIKRLPVTTYRSQRRGGRGLTGAKTREEDFIEHLFVANTHSYILFFTDRGRCYWLKVYNAPLGKRLSKGRSILNLLDIGPQERITAFVPVDQFDPQHYVVLATRRGQIKKTPLSAFANPRRKGIWAMRLAAEDVLIGAGVTGGSAELVLAKRSGKAIRFPETKVRAMGRGAAGVRGVTLESPEDEVVGMVCVTDPEATLLVVTEKGFGKRSRLDDYRVTNRGGRGVITVRNTPRNGPIVAIKQVGDDEEVMLTTSNGMVIRLKMSGVSVLGRATQGVRLIHLQEGDSVADVAKVALSGEPAAGEENGAAEEAGQADDGGAGADAGAGAGGAAGGGDEDEGIGEDEGGEEPDAGS
ncbi:MAG: DNA gyrase subunit A [Candidatus Eisenbacteria bacterium]|uniref:DNA gyrase subunit A n=1 Tax=Eiseniibacteriota bacterium TaxID=2212470 RepID=A0A937X716_UNCEI|nr:DNA gyrase subunit A [Candidatus Eisenbacteria bacterium]